MSGQSSCIKCPVGEYSDPGGIVCEPCPVASYNPDIGSAECKKCPRNRVSNIGSFDLSQCVDPIPNFVIGFVLLGALAALASPYIFLGRFHQVSFNREHRALALVKRSFEKIRNGFGVALPDSTMYSDETCVTTRRSWRWLYIATYCFVSFVLNLLLILLLYIFYLSRCLYNSMIIWRGVHFALGIDEFYNKMHAVASALADDLGLAFLSKLIYPFIQMVDFFATLKINLGDFEVTCRGSQAPVELTINCVALCMVVLIIESNFHIYSNAVLVDGNIGIARSLLKNKSGIKGRNRLMLFLFIVAFIAFTNPLVKVLQYAMSVLNFSVFTSRYGILHDSTEACNVIAGVPNIDTALASISSALALWMLVPAIYTMARVVTPFGAELPEKYLPEKYQPETHNFYSE